MNGVEMRVLTCRLIEKINNNPDISAKAGVSYKAVWNIDKKKSDIPSKKEK